MIDKNENEFELFCRFHEYMESSRDNIEEEICDFIDEEWNPHLEYYVDCKDNHIISIMVCDILERESFELFIINPLCEKYGLDIGYVETVESDFPYIEWGLISKEIEY